MRRLQAACFHLVVILPLILFGVSAFDDSSAFTIEVSEPLSDSNPPSCDAPELSYTPVPYPVGNAIRDIDRGPGDPPSTSTQHSFADDGAPFQFNTSSNYVNLSIHEVVGHVHSRGGFDVVVIEMNRLTTGVSSSIHPDAYFDTRESISFPMRSNNMSNWSEVELQDSVRTGGGPITNTEFRSGALDSVNHLFVTLISNRTSLFMLTFPSDAGAPDTSTATSVNDVKLPADLPPLAHVSGLQFDNFTQIFYGAALSLDGEAYVLSLTPATRLEAIYRDCSLPKRSGYPPRLCDRESIVEFLANGTRADFQRSAVVMQHHKITSATAISLTAFDRASRIFMVIVMNGEQQTRPCSDNYTSSFDLVGVRVTALFASQRQAFRVRLEGDAAVAMECDNLLGTCFLLRLRQKVFEYVKFSSVTGQVLRVLIAPTLRQGEVLCPHQFAVGVASFDAYESRFLTLSIQDIAEMSPDDKSLLRQFETDVFNAQVFNLTAYDVFINASDDVKSMLAQRNSAFGEYLNLPPPLLPYRVFGGADSQVPEFPPTDEMSRVHTAVVGARVSNLVTPNFLDTLGPIAEDEAAFVPPDPLEDKVFLDSSTYNVNSTRKVVTMIAYEFSDKPYFFGTVGGVSVASSKGGLRITVIGDHFQPSGFAVARFTDTQSWFPYFVTLHYMNKTHAFLFTPKIPSPVAVHVQLSNNGYIFSQGAGSVGIDDDGFAFYEVASRRPISGSAIGRTGVVMRGGFLRNIVKANASCIFSACDNINEILSRTEWSEELGTAVCFSPPVSACTDLFIASTFRVLIGYEVLLQDIWFYVSAAAPTILRANFDSSLRTITVRLQASTNLGGYSKSESCAALFTIQSQFFILTSTVVFWPEPYTLVLLLDPAHKLRFNSILEISDGGIVTDASDKSLTLAGAIKFLAPDFIAAPTPILTCPLHSHSSGDIFFSAYHTFGLLLQNVSFLWNVWIVYGFGYTESLNSNFTFVDESVILISTSNLSFIPCPPTASNCSVELHAQFTVFFNSSTGGVPLDGNMSLSNPTLRVSTECSSFKNVQDAVKKNAANCVLWPSVSAKCISKLLFPSSEPSGKVHIDRPFNSSFRVSSNSEVYFRAIVTDTIYNQPLAIHWKLFTKKSGLMHQEIKSFCTSEIGANATIDSLIDIGGPFELHTNNNSSINITGPSDNHDNSTDSSCLKGSSSLNVIFTGAADGTSYNINLPFDFRWLSKMFNGNVFVSSNSYVTFGGGHTAFESLDGKNPAFPTLFIGSADTRVLRLMSGHDSRGWRVRFEGTNDTIGNNSRPNVVWELLLRSSGGLELCTGTLQTRPGSISSLSDGMQPQMVSYALKPNSFYVFQDKGPKSVDVSSDTCDLNAFLKTSFPDLALLGPTLLLPRYSLPPGSYEITVSLYMLENNVNLHSDQVDLQVLSVHSNPVAFINGAVSSGSPVFVESGSLVCVQLDLVSSCQVTEPTAFSESLSPKDPDFEDIQSSFKAIVSKSRQFVSLYSDDLIVLSSFEFSRLFCSRCNDQISFDALAYVDQLFGSVQYRSDSDIEGVDDFLEASRASNVSYSLEQVCFQHFPLNSTHFAKNCSMFLNATLTKFEKYANDSDPQGFSWLEESIVHSTFVCQYNQSYFNVLHKDPSLYATRLNPLYRLQWSCITRPSRESSSGYHSISTDDSSCSNFTASPQYAAAIFFDQVAPSMVVRISCIVSSPHISWFLPVEVVMVLYPFQHMSVPTQQRIPVSPSLIALTPENVEVQRAHLLRHSNSSSTFVTFNANPVSPFNYASEIRWESRVSWASDISSKLEDSMLNSELFILNSQLSLPSSLLSLGFPYIFRVSHFFRGQLSGFSEIVVNMSAPFFQGKVSVSQLQYGNYRISKHHVNIEDDERPLQFSFLQSLDYDLTLQPMGYMQTYTGPLYNRLGSNNFGFVFILTRSASACTVRTNVSVLLSGPQVIESEFSLNQFRLGNIDFFLSSLLILQSYRALTLNSSSVSSLMDSNYDFNSRTDALFEIRFLKPFATLLSLQHRFSQENHSLLYTQNEVNFTEILKQNSTTSLKFAVPGQQGNEHSTALLFEAFNIYMNGSIPSSDICRRMIAIVTRLINLKLPFSIPASSSLFGIIARCFDPDINLLTAKIQQLQQLIANGDVLDRVSGINTSSPIGSVATNATDPKSTSSRSVDRNNPPSRSFLSDQGSMYGTCYMRVGAIEADLTNDLKSYSVLPANGDPSTWNVVFRSTLIVSSTNLSVYRHFSRGSNPSLTVPRSDPEYMSNSFGGSWSDSDTNITADVANSTRVSGVWGGPGTGLTALFKLFDQSYQGLSESVLVELGWVLLDESKKFDETHRFDAELLTFPFDNSWNVTQDQLSLLVAPYRCRYTIMSPASTPAPRSVMAPNSTLAESILSGYKSQRQLLQQSNIDLLRSDITSSAQRIIGNLLDDFSAVCDRIRASSSTSGAPTAFSFFRTAIYSRSFYTRSGIVFETPEFIDGTITCSSVAVRIQSDVPAHPSLNFHRSSICIGVTAKRLAPSSPTQSGTVGATKINTACTIMYKLHHGAYDRSTGLIKSTVLFSFFIFPWTWARLKDSKSICQIYQSSTNSFTTFGVPTSPPSEALVTSFELLPNRTESQVCLISRSTPLFSITTNRVTCRFDVIPEFSVVPSQGLLAMFQEFVDCTGAMNNMGTRCDGCNVCLGNGSSCNADCDTAVASGRKYDDCQLCGGSTFFQSSSQDGLPWRSFVGEKQALDKTAFRRKFCPATRIFSHPPDPVNIVTQENVIIPRNKPGREKEFAMDTTCFVMFEDLPSRVPVGIASISGQNEYNITVEIIGGFIGYSMDEVLLLHNQSSDCLRACDDVVADFLKKYRSCAVQFSNETLRIEKCGLDISPLCDCNAGVNSIQFPRNLGEPSISFRGAVAPVLLYEPGTFPEIPSKLYFSNTRDFWIIPFNDKNTRNQILSNSEPIPCFAEELQKFSSDEAWNATKDNYRNTVKDRDKGKTFWTDASFSALDNKPRLLLRFILRQLVEEVRWEILERKVMSFYVQPVNDAPRIVVPKESVEVSEDSLTPVPELLLLDDGKDTDEVVVTFSLNRGFATSFTGLVAPDVIKLEKVFSSKVLISNLEAFIREFRLVSPDNSGLGNFDVIQVDVVETFPAGFGKALTTSAFFNISYTAQSIPDLPAVFLSIPDSSLTFSENSLFRLDVIGLGYIANTDSNGVRNNISAPSLQFKISCRGPFGVLFIPQSTGRRILDNSIPPLCAKSAFQSPKLMSSFPEIHNNSQICRDVILFGRLDQIEKQVHSIVYSAFRYDFSLLEATGLVLTMIGPPSQNPSDSTKRIVNENKVFVVINVLFFSSANIDASITRHFEESWALLQRFSPPFSWSFEDVPALFRSTITEFTSESAEQLYSITVSSRLNRVYISPPYRDRVNFEVGTGLLPENKIVFQASSKIVRDALNHIMYVSKKNYNTEFQKSIELCSRQCFAYQPNSPEAQESDCSSACKGFVRQYLASQTRTNDLFLDDIMVDINDLGSGGLGITRFSVKLHSPVFVAAINDGPCLSFLGSVFVNCFDLSGNAILSSPSFTFEVDEGTSLSINLGEFAVQDYDMFEKGRPECMNSSLVADAKNKFLMDGDLDAKLFLSTCPVIKVSISAKMGLVNINFRSGMTIYEGSVDQFTPSMKYFGSMEEVTQSLRNVRYRLSSSMRTFNHLRGLEYVTVSVDDGGFSGADPVGQFENVAASSIIQVPIKILPINNPPQVLLPSSSGGSFEAFENVVGKRMRDMVPFGQRFSVTDIDSDECNGYISVSMSVNIGYLDVSFMKGQAIISRIQDLKFSQPMFPVSPTPTYCNVISFSARAADVEEILSKTEYRPPPFVNSEMLDPRFPATITVTASDQNSFDGSFYCGRQLASTPGVIRSTSEILIKATNDAPDSSFSQSALLNGHFESPSLCGGRQFYSAMPNGYSWASIDAFLSNGAVDSSIADTPAFLQASIVGSDTDLVHSVANQGTQWVVILRRGFIRQHFSTLLAPDGLYSVSVYISRPSTPAVASDCEILIIHRDGSILQKTFVSNIDIQAEPQWLRIQTPSFSGSSCGYTSVDSFNANFSCGIMIRSVPTSRGDSWGFAVDGITLEFDGFQSFEGARIPLRGFEATDPDINFFSLASWAAASVSLQIQVSLSVEFGSLFFKISPGIMNVSSLVRMFPKGCNSSDCFEDVCSLRFRESNESAPNCFNRGVILFADCTLEQMRSFRSSCDSDVPVNGVRYPAGSKLTWNSLLPGALPQPCPDGWSLIDDQLFLLQNRAQKACVNMGLSQLKGSFLSGTAHSVLVGSPTAINQVLSSLHYVPRLNFNSQSNRGSEYLSVDVNDLGHSRRANETVLNTFKQYPIFIIAINNPPRIDTLISELFLNEDSGPVPITFLSFVDVDSEEPPGVSISLKLSCSHCKFSFDREASLASIQQVDSRVGNLFIEFKGRLPAIQTLFQSRLVYYEPFHDYFGTDIIFTEFDDSGGSGLGNFDTIHNLPPPTILKNIPLIATNRFPVVVKPVNDVSKLILEDEATGSRLTLSQSGEVAILPLLRQQGTPQPFNFIFVEDVDSDLGISISLSCQNGLWISSATNVMYNSENSGRTVSVVSGNRTEINIWLKGLSYLADETFLGSEDVVVQLSDNVTDPVSLAGPTKLKITIPLSVLPIIRCLFNDCKTCNEQKDSKSACGWCPSACNGQGRCLEAQLNQASPKFGICPPTFNGQKWMMCTPPETDLVTPVVLGYSLSTIIAIGAVAFFYSYRLNYGSFRSSIRSKVRRIRTFARDFNLLPHKDFQFVKMFVVACCGAVAVVVPTMLGIAPSTGFNEILTGASRLTIKSDHCEIVFKDEIISNGPVVRLNWEYFQDPAISILTNFCSPFQTFSVVNDRPAATKYQNYFCKLTFFSEASTLQLYPSLFITAAGNNPTSVSDAFRTSPIFLGPNVLSIDGTWANVDLRDFTAGQVLVPLLQRGYINLNNVTAMKYKIKTLDASVFIQTPIAKPASVVAVNPFSDVCLIHNAPKLVSDSAASAFQNHISYCNQTCLNATYETGQILPPCGEYVFPNCTDDPTFLHKVPYFNPLIPGSFDTLNTNVSCIFRCDSSFQSINAPPILLSPSTVKSSNPYDVQISTQTGKITFITVGNSYPPSIAETTMALKPFDTSPNVSPIDLNVLNTFFHPLGSGTFPSVDIIRILFVGPGAPPGFFIWSVDPRFLLLPIELLDAASFGLLVPTQKLVRLPVSSTSCPPYDPVRGGADIIAFYSIIFRGINKEIIPNSVFAFNDGKNTGAYDQFYFDDNVKSLQTKPLRFSDNSVLFILLIMGIAIPIVVGFICGIAAVLKFRATKTLLVTSACENEARCIQMKTAGSSEADDGSVKELVTDDMRQRFDRKMGVFYAIEYLWADPDVEQSVVTKVGVGFTHCIIIAVVVTPMVAFAELYQKSFVSNNCPFASNPDQCQKQVTAVMQASSILVKIFPILAVLELVCYHGRFAHSFLRRIVYLLFCASLVSVSCISVAVLTALVLWTSFAVVTNPQKVVPFLIGGICIIAHAVRLYPVALSAREKVRKALHQRSLQVTSRLIGTLPLPLMSNIVNRQVSQFLETQNLSLRAIIRLFVFSIMGLLLVIALLLLALSVFSAPSIVMCLVGSFSVVCAAAIMHRLSVARFRIDDDNLNSMTASSIIGIKKSLDFVLRQMSQAARLLKAMEGGHSPSIEEGADSGAASNRNKSYRQAAQIAIMHDGARAPLPPTAPPPIPRLWRKRPIVHPQPFSSTQLPLPPHVQQQVQDTVYALQAESRWPAVRATGSGVSQRQIRLGIRTARALAEDLSPAAAANVVDSSTVENAFAAGVGRYEPDVLRGASQRLVRTRTVRALSDVNPNSDTNPNP